jgi:hypothetical protein
MKKLFLSLVTLASMINYANAAILRCNNNVGITGANIYSTLQAAHNAASMGDTIHLEPSPNSYGSLTMNKRLFIVSIGGFLTTYPGNQYSPTPSYCDGININNTGANNSVISVAFNGTITIQNSVSGVQIRNCYGLTTNLGQSHISIQNSANNILVTQSWIGSVAVGNSSSNITFTNNIVMSYFYVESNSSAIIENNVIHALTSWNGGQSISNSTVRNNIFAQSTCAYSNCIVTNNMSAFGATSFPQPTANGNLINQTMTNVFVNPSAVVDSGFVLKAASPAIGTGFGGVNMGAFDGPLPYKLGVQPRIPAITNITAPSVPTTNTINVNFSTKSN